VAQPTQRLLLPPQVNETDAESDWGCARRGRRGDGGGESGGGAEGGACGMRRRQGFRCHIGRWQRHLELMSKLWVVEPASVSFSDYREGSGGLGWEAARRWVGLVGACFRGGGGHQEQQENEEEETTKEEDGSHSPPIT
jgi:hypothetical protein